MKNTQKIIALVITIIVVASGVAYFVIENSSSAKSINASGNITVTDSLGRSFTFAHPVHKIVSIDPSAVVTLYALGAYHDLVGGSQFDYYPPNSTKQIPNVGDYYGINTEEILNLSPQVVLTYGDSLSKDAAYINNTLHIPVLVDNPNSFSAIENMTTMLGRLTGTVANATKINNWMNQSISTLENQTKNITYNYSVFYLLSTYGGYWTAGNGTFINSIFKYAHLHNIASKNGYFTMSAENIVSSNPQVIFFSQYEKFSAVDREPFNSTSAFYNNRIYPIFNDNFFNQPDFRVIYALWWVISTVYPGTQAHIPPFPIKLKYPPTTGF